MHSDLDARQRRAVRLGVAGAILAFLALTGVQALAIRPYPTSSTASATRPPSWTAGSRP